MCGSTCKLVRDTIIGSAMVNEKKNKLPSEIKIEDTTLGPYIPLGHKRPKTRREFMAYGFYGISTTIVLPSFASLVFGQNEAYAETIACELPQFSAGLPYLCVDVGGGMNIAGANVLVGMVSGGEHQEDYGSSSSDYVQLGITSAETPKNSDRVVDKYGLKFHRASGILAGMNEVLDGELMPNGKPISDGIDGLIFCTRTSDDTATNQLNTIYMANKAGAKGELVQLVGNDSTDTGARSAAPSGQVDLNIRPSQVAKHEDTKGLLSLGSTLSGNAYLRSDDGDAGKARIQKFMERVSKMSKSKIDDLSKKSSLGQIKDVLNCSTEGAKQLFSQYTASSLDSAADAQVQTVFGTEGTDAKIASVARLVLDSIAGAGSITVGGGDYHGNAAQGTHNKDMEVGRAIGKCILLAKEKGKNLALHLYTDGGVAGDAGGVTEPVETLGTGNGNVVEKIKWTGDSGTRSSAVLFVYKHDHDGSSLVQENANGPRRQVGNFLKAGGVNLNTIIGNSTENLWKAIMLNYLAAQGKEGDFETIFGRGSLPTGYEQLIRLKKII